MEAFEKAEKKKSEFKNFFFFFNKTARGHKHVYNISIRFYKQSYSCISAAGFIIITPITWTETYSTN